MPDITEETIKATEARIDSMDIEELHRVVSGAGLLDKCIYTKTHLPYIAKRALHEDYAFVAPFIESLGVPVTVRVWSDEKDAEVEMPWTAWDQHGGYDEWVKATGGQNG